MIFFWLKQTGSLWIVSWIQERNLPCFIKFILDNCSLHSLNHSGFITHVLVQSFLFNSPVAVFAKKSSFVYSTENKKFTDNNDVQTIPGESLCHTHHSLYSLFQCTTMMSLKGFSVTSFFFFSRFMCVMIFDCPCETKVILIGNHLGFYTCFDQRLQKRKREGGKILVWIITFFGKLKWFISNDRLWKISIVFFET